MRILYLLATLLCLSFGAWAQSVQSACTDVEHAIEGGDAAKLFPYFGSTVDLRILETENVYGNAQAQVLLSNFFTSHPPASFVVAHRKLRSDNSFFIGTYISNANSYRISVFLKTEQDKTRISQILIQNSGLGS